MATVSLDFVQPQDDNIAALRIYECPTQAGSFTMIERVDEIGTYPNYITRYSTDQATDVNNWFAIAWEDDAGVVSELSAPVPGNKDTLVSKLVDRILLRDPSIKEGIAVQEAEAVLWLYLGEDPYTTEKTLNPNEMSGLTYLALARIYMFNVAVTATVGDKYTAGIVSQDSGSSSASKSSGASIEDLFKLGEGILGLNVGVIAQMRLPYEDGLCGCYVRLDAVTYDETRLLAEIEIP